MLHNTLGATSVLVVLVAAALGLGCGADDGAPAQHTEELEPCTIQDIAIGLSHPFGILSDGDDLVVGGWGQLSRIGPAPDYEVTPIADLTSGTGMVRIGDTAYGLDFQLQQAMRYEADTWQPMKVADLGVGGITLAADGDDLIVSGFVDPENKKNPLLRVKLDGTVETVADENLGAPAGVLTDDEGYVLADFENGRLLRVTRDGAVSELVTGLGNPVEFRKYDDAYYVANYNGAVGDGQILKVSLDGSEVTEVEIESGYLGNPSSMLIRGKDMILTDDPGGRVMLMTGCLP